MPMIQKGPATLGMPAKSSPTCGPRYPSDPPSEAMALVTGFFAVSSTVPRTVKRRISEKPRVTMAR
jgi:hypothetical protein